MAEVHLSLKKYPSIFFFAQIIDPEGVEDAETVVAAIMEHYDIEKCSMIRLNNLLLTKIKRTGERDLFFEVQALGFIRLYHDYRLFKYTTKSGKLVEMELSHYSVLEINGKVVQRKTGWNLAEAISFRESVEALFSSDSSKTKSWQDIFCALWPIFTKGSRNKSMNVFGQCCRDLSSQEKEGDFGNWMSHYARFIADKYLEYLWDQYEENKPVKYILSLQSFIDQNKEQWLNGINEELRLRLYDVEHEEAEKIFVKEPDVSFLSKSKDFCILQVWMYLKIITTGGY